MRPGHVIALSIASILAGCSPKQPPLAPPTPHGGMIFTLPNESGSIEVVRQAVAEKPGSVRLLVFCLDPQMKPASPAPTAATLKLRGRGASSIDFKPSSDADPSKAGALESADLPDRGDIDGELSTTINGKPVALSISVR